MLDQHTLEAAVALCAGAPRTTPGEGDWRDLETAYGCGIVGGQYDGAALLRRFLAAFYPIIPAESYAGTPVFQCVACDATWHDDELVAVEWDEDDLDDTAGVDPKRGCRYCHAACREIADPGIVTPA